MEIWTLAAIIVMVPVQDAIDGKSTNRKIQTIYGKVSYDVQAVKKAARKCSMVRISFMKRGVMCPRGRKGWNDVERGAIE